VRIAPDFGRTYPPPSRSTASPAHPYYKPLQSYQKGHRVSVCHLSALELPNKPPCTGRTTASSLLPPFPRSRSEAKRRPPDILVIQDPGEGDAAEQHPWEHRREEPLRTPHSPLSWPEAALTTSTTWPGVEPSATQWCGLKKKKRIPGQTKLAPSPRLVSPKGTPYDKELDKPHWPTEHRLHAGSPRPVGPGDPLSVGCEEAGCNALHYCGMRPAQRVRLAASFALTVARQAGSPRRPASCNPPFDERGNSIHPKKQYKEPSFQYGPDGWKASAPFWQSPASQSYRQIKLSSGPLKLREGGTKSSPVHWLHQSELL